MATRDSEAENIDTATEPNDPSKGIEPQPTQRPSQAEGDVTPGDDMEEIANKPSQAEGDRETVLEDLEEKEASGEL